MLDPRRLGFGAGLDAAVAVRAHEIHAAAIQSTCCSMETIMLLITDGLPGPVMVNRFGKPAMPRPSSVRGPSAHLSFSAHAIDAADVDIDQAPVMASKPVANTMQSKSRSRSAVRMPPAVMAVRASCASRPVRHAAG
jgi:hypothetical protein